jgi:diguanylate cyclase (GGDEF)-like protein
MRLQRRTTPAGIVDLTGLSGHDPTGRETAAEVRDRVAATRDARALHNDRLIASALDALLSGGGPPDLKDSIAAADWPAVVHHLMRAAAADRQQAAGDRRAAAEDRHAAARDREFASRDDLTGAWRRDAGLRVLTAEMDRSRRSGLSLVVGYLDVAGLKAINDAYGHPAGDRTLVALVQTLRVQMRSYDSVIRMGGDEFVCILPETPLMAARRRLEQLRQRLSNFEPPITVRVGLADLRDDDTPLTLLARADDALLASRGLPPAMQLVTG